MALSNNLIEAFVKATYDNKQEDKETTLYGTATKVGDQMYAKLDGSDRLTPLTLTTDVKEGERVLVLLKNHSAIATGNLTTPSASKNDVEDINNSIVAQNNVITALNNNIKIINEDITAQNDTIISQGNKITAIENKIDLHDNHISILDSNINAIDTIIDSQNSKITTIESTINNLNTTIDNQNSTISNINSNIDNINSRVSTNSSAIDIYNSSFKIENGQVTGIKTITGLDYIETKDLEADHAIITSLNNKYANIDFANIGEAAIKKLFADSGIIKDLVMKEGYVTGELVGVTIKGDLVETNTLVADKLIVKGKNGLFYKLNTDGVTTTAEQTEYNSLSGTVITAKSVTAEKINVSDLVAFDATIGGFNITESSIYSGVKSSVDNTTRGLYLDKDGQVAFGDAYNFIKYFKDTDGSYKLDISADTVHLGSNGKNVEEIFNETIRSQYEEFYQSSSPTELLGGNWSDAQPIWENGKYIWKRTIVTYNDGTTVYMPSEEGLCITGNTGIGVKGDDGVGIDTALSGVYYQVSSSGTELVPVFLLSDESGNVISDEDGNNILSDYWSTQVPAVSGGQYLWTKTVIAYTDGTNTESYNAIYIPKNGEDGNGISLITEYYAVSSSNSTAPNSWSTTVPTMNASNKYLWNYEAVTYTNGLTEETSKRVIGVYGEPGKDGVGISKIANYYLASTASSGVTTSTSGWTEDIQTITESKKHLWNYEVVTYTDGTTYTSKPCIIGVYGLSGTDGTGVESITAQYYVSDSKEEPANGEWTTKTPTWSVGKYLWIRYAIVYTNSSTPVNTTPYCDSSWEAVNEIKIGGRNFLINSNFATGNGDIHTELYQLLDENGNYIVDENENEIISEDWYPVTPDHWDEWGSPTARELVLINEEPWVHIITDTSASTKYQGYQQSVTEGVSGYEYTVQARFRTSSMSDVPIAIGVHCRNDSNTIIQQFWFTDNITRNNGVYILYGTFTFPSGATNFNVMIGTNSGLTDIYDFYFTKAKLEYGNKITDWSLANDDIPTLDRVDSIDENLSNLGKEFEDMEAGINYRLNAIENFISMGITDENGATLVTQTDNGWTWSLGDTLDSIKGLTKDIDNTMTLANKSAVDLEKLNQLITTNDIANKLAYIFVDKVEDSNGVAYPVMTFGNSSEFALQITNTAINFKHLNETIAYISNEKLHIGKADVDDELEFGNFAWKQHGAKGNIGLIWKGS